MRIVFVFGLVGVFLQIFSVNGVAQKRKPKVSVKSAVKKTQPSKIKAAPSAAAQLKVTQIDAVALGNLLKRDGSAEAKPLLVNFWATWCDPCREEFPDLVKIDSEYKGKIDFITVSLDDLAEIKRDVPKFLLEMKAAMPAYLLKTQDEEAAIATVSKEWKGGLPFTVLLNGNGEIVYDIQGKVKTEVLRAEIDKITVTNNSGLTTNPQINNLPNLRAQYTYEKGKSDAKIDIANNKFIIRTYGLMPGISQQSLDELRKKHGIEIFDDSWKPVEYLKGYNEISKAEIKRKFGLEF